MKATVEMINNRYYITGLHTPSVEPADVIKAIGKPVYEMFYLHGLGSKSYKTLANAIRAITKANLEYIPAKSVVMVCGWD